MPIITVREQQPTATGFQAILEFDGTENQIGVADPFTLAEEQCLEWYFEEWLMFPLIDKVKAEQARESVNNYGQRLFKQVFKSNIDAYAEYRQFRNNLSLVQIEIAGKTPKFQALHWEAMQDPDLPRPLAVDCVMVQKQIQPVAVKANVQSSPVINLLVVTARPDEENDIGYRTIPRPLIEVIQNSQLLPAMRFSRRRPTPVWIKELTGNLLSSHTWKINLLHS
ncbi:MAG TPA: hypothetical protein V6D15_01995 [Oculatellaceae cyanobacterium]|jgi:hypothetical protein